MKPRQVLFTNCVLLFLVLVFPSLSWGATPITWTPTELNYTIGNGMQASDPVVVSFISTELLNGVNLTVVPALAGFVTIQPSYIPTVQPGTTYSVNLVFSIPPNAAQGSYSGTLHVIAGTRTIPQTLKITVDVNYGSNVIAPNTTVLSPQTEQFLSSISSDLSTLVFTQSTPELVSLQPGSVLILGVSPNSPNGFIGRVTSMSTNGSNIVVQTVPASLADAFTSANLSIARNLVASGTTPLAGGISGVSKSQLRRPGARHLAGARASALQASSSDQLSDTCNFTTSSSSFSLTCSDVVLYEAGGASVTADGSLTVTPSLALSLSIQNGSITQFSFVDTTTAAANLTVNSSAEFSVSKEVELDSFDLPVIVVWLGWVPVVITPEFDITAGIDGSVSAGLSMSASQNASFSAGAQYASGSWQPVSTFSNSFKFQIPSPTAAASADGFIQPQLDLLIDDVVGPSVDLHPFIELDVTPFTGPQYQLFGGLDVGVGVIVQVLDETLADFEDPTLISYKQLLLQGNFGPPTITGVSPTPLPAPTSAGVYFTGTFVISGQNFQGATVTTDGPLFLTGAATINPEGTVISQGYQIGCCAPQQGQIFHLFVNTPGGSASIVDTITLTQ